MLPKLPGGFDLVTLPPLPATEPRPSQLLVEASSSGDVHQVVDLLAAWGSTPDLSLKDLENALSSAVRGGRISVVKLLLDHGVPITRTTNIWATREEKPNTLEIFKLFLQYGWNVNSTAGRLHNVEYMTMSDILCHQDSETLLHWFLSNGASANGIPSDPTRPLRAAVEVAPNLAVPRLLLSNGATLKSTGALHCATRRNDELSIEMMKLLIDEGIEIDEVEYEGWSLLPRHARSQWTDWETPLHTAARYGFVSKARLLVENGADMQKKSKHGYTARDRARLCENEDVKAYLEAVMRERGMEIKDLELPQKDSDEDEIPTWRALD